MFLIYYLLSSFRLDLKKKISKNGKQKKMKTKSKPETKNIQTKKKAKNSKIKNKETEIENSGIVIIDDDLKENKEVAMAERKAYLEEARSQESSD